MQTKTRRTYLFILSIHHISLIQSTIFAFKHSNNLFINCGGNATLQLGDGRTFVPDAAAPAASGSHPSFDFSPVSHNVVTSSSIDLYATARVFNLPTKYTFKIHNNGRHLLRLHFYPLGNLRSAKFSVFADEFVLLYNYSFSGLVMKEYVIETSLKSNAIALALLPCHDSVAFINAVEVISLPVSLFSSIVLPIGGGDVSVSARVALETIYRIDVGGPFLDSKNDSLWRVWLLDGPFLVNPASARNVSVDPNGIRFSSDVTVEAAPALVYATAQEMADAKVGNQKFNVSWVFDVEPGFSYLVRLHFCDFLSKALHSLVFNVYVNNQSALKSFDVSGKARGLSMPYFVNFVVRAEFRRMLVQIGPPEMSSLTPNAILNGIEIFKVSDLDGSLDPLFSKNSESFMVSKKSKRLVVVILSTLGGIALVLGIVVAIYLVCFCSKRSKDEVKNDVAWIPPSPIPCCANAGYSETKVSAGSYASSVPSLGLGQVIAFSEIREATKNFDENLLLGVGGFGKVYEGVLENGLTVAVKRGNPRSQQGLVEFRTEVEMLSKLRHRHLVSLIGYCQEPNERVLVYEFMAGGPLRKHLYGSDLPPLSWKQRLEICVGAAKGLHYLHTGAAETIIHRDVKTTNILLDENLNAKVADFGLSKSGSALDQTHVSTAVKGSFGYLDPDYFRRQQLTQKSDVYSFGVVLMEVLCARPAINPALPREQVNIVEWAMHWQRRSQLHQIIDSHLAGSVSPDSLRKYGETAEKCLAEHGVDRPTMGDVLWNLEYALQLQVSFTKEVGNESSSNGISELPAWIPTVGHVVHDSFGNVSADGSNAATTRSRLFSQLMDPKGRQQIIKD